jgi:hypothetical protein
MNITTQFLGIAQNGKLQLLLLENPDGDIAL